MKCNLVDLMIQDQFWYYINSVLMSLFATDIKYNILKLDYKNTFGEKKNKVHTSFPVTKSSKFTFILQIGQH